MLYLPFRVDVVENGVCVALVAGCEDDNVEVFADVLDDLLGVGTDVDVATDDLSLQGFEGHLYLVALHHDLACVDQSLVHVEDHSFST